MVLCLIERLQFGENVAEAEILNDGGLQHVLWRILKIF